MATFAALWAAPFFGPHRSLDRTMKIIQSNWVLVSYLYCPWAAFYSSPLRSLNEATGERESARRVER